MTKIISKGVGSQKKTYRCDFSRLSFALKTQVSFLAGLQNTHNSLTNYFRMCSLKVKVSPSIVDSRWSQDITGIPTQGSIILCFWCHLLLMAWEWPKVGYGLGSLTPPLWHTWMDFLVPGFGLARPWLLQASGEWTKRWMIHILCSSAF